jgi:hypothetical protein
MCRLLGDLREIEERDWLENYFKGASLEEFDVMECLRCFEFFNKKNTKKPKILNHFLTFKIFREIQKKIF